MATAPVIVTVPVGTNSPEQIYSACDLYTITPSDSVPLNFGFTRGIYVGVTGNVKVTTVNGTSAIFVAVPAGYIIPVAAKLIWSTGTTATSIVGMK